MFGWFTRDAVSVSSFLIPCKYMTLLRGHLYLSTTRSDKRNPDQVSRILRNTQVQMARHRLSAESLDVTEYINPP